MPKKKSYMDVKNVLNEGFFETLLQKLLPSGVKKSITNAYVKKKKSDIKKAEQELRKSYQRSEKLYTDARKHLKTQGVDLPKSGDDKGFDEFFDKMIKRAKGRV